jgi:hypothetical protein
LMTSDSIGLPPFLKPPNQHRTTGKPFGG